VITLDHVTKRYGNGHVAVQDLSLEVGEGEIAVLVGPSGCGKTTTMKMVNRLIEPSSGTISVGGDDVGGVDAVGLRRRIGYVIQHVGLFPHQTVATNVATVPRLLGWDRRKRADRVNDMLELVGLQPSVYGDRYPHQLSGGQQQRVGVARALAADPPVLLMDEPFGAIDPITRDRLQQEFLNLQAELRKTILFVTHDINEAVRMGDRIALLADGGVLQQYDTPDKILGQPANDFVADFVGEDRGLKRLSATPLRDIELLDATYARPDTTMADLERLIADATVPIALVRDNAGRTTGWVSGGPKPDGTVGLLIRELQSTVPADGTLRDALAELLLHDTGWVAITDGDDAIGLLTADSIHAASRGRYASSQGNGSRDGE
jgi:osmoprotectant transport system ATP-binding protein